VDVAVQVAAGRVVGRRDPRIYGYFIEHFHRQVYGGIYDPASPLADESGLRVDVLRALREVRPPVIRWPGGCFASAYHWKDGVGRERSPVFDKAWRVEEPNTFGTDEFAAFCRRVGAEPYLCANAGSGTAEEMSDWVEYCNLRDKGHWARQRRANGHPEPHAVRLWSIGNENYLAGEIGARTLAEWGPFVRECAKMMKRIDPTIQIVAPCVGRDPTYRSAAADFDWNARLLQEAGPFVDWVSIHGYWDRLNRTSGCTSAYDSCVFFSSAIEERILPVKRLLGELGLQGRVRIAFDEWNLRSWHHPALDAADENEYLPPRDINDLNTQYTTADAVFAACFLNQCLKHCAAVGMACFSPLVNGRGALFVHPDGIVRRPTFHVFSLYVNLMGDTVIDCRVAQPPALEVEHEGARRTVAALDAAATLDSGSGAVVVALVNRDDARSIDVSIDLPDRPAGGALFRFLAAADRDAYNDVDHPEAVHLEDGEVRIGRNGRLGVELPPHSVGVVRI
jgi:alpha-N-arabinofuranosidase